MAEQRKRQKSGQVFIVETDPSIRHPYELADHLIQRPLPVEATEQIELVRGDAEKVVSIGIGLGGTLREDLIHLLREYADIFAWSACDMLGLDESVAMHRLDVDPNREPVKQRQRMFTP